MTAQGYDNCGLQVPAGSCENIEGTRSQIDTPVTQPSSASVRTAIISRLRRERDPAQHERLSLLAAQLKNGAPAAFIARQVELIGGTR